MIHFQLNQSRLKGGQRLPRVCVRKVLAACWSALKLKGDAFVSIAFVSRSQMRRLNKVWRGKDKVTDVLSFQLDEGLLKGEILLNYEQAAFQARQMNHSPRRELCFLIVHGVLHLWGYDHESAKDEKRMLALQEQILHTLKI